MGDGCGSNITRAFAHLDPECPGCEQGDVPEAIWNAVIGAAAPAIDALCAEFENSDDPVAAFLGR
eukprot:4398114-Lingulodinium_polyedra.AAC.1